MQTRSPRFSKQMQQEDVSVPQLMERLAKYGWVVNRIGRDLGEDLLVQIYADGSSTGLDFYVQLKSVRDLDKRSTRKGVVGYPFDVKDLEHWEVSATPVTLLIWDVGRKFGRWLNVSEAVTWLDKHRPAWRNQTTVTIAFPASNTTEDAGLLCLRRTVADHFLPVVSAGKPLSMSIELEFPPNEDGQAKLEAFQRCMTAGDSVELDRRFIRAVTPSDWWTRLYGDSDSADWHVDLGPVPIHEPFPWRLDVMLKAESLASIHYLDLRVLKHGSEEVTFSNEAQPIPLSVRIVFRHPSGECEMSLTVRKGITAVDQVYEALCFLRALNAGDTLRVTTLKDQVAFRFPLVEPRPDAPDALTMDLMRKLVDIQTTTGCKLAMRPDWSLTPVDAADISEVEQIIQTGRLDRDDQIMNGRFKKPAVDLILKPVLAGQSLRFRLTYYESWVDLLGTKVGLGPSIRYVTGHLDMSVEGLQIAMAAMGPDDELPLRIVHAQVTDRYEDWPRGDAERQSELPTG